MTETQYRIIKYGEGFEASMFTKSGLGGEFWTPLLETGYWAEPESFNTGIVKGLHLLTTFEAAEKAIIRARLINRTGAILSLVENSKCKLKT